MSDIKDEQGAVIKQSNAKPMFQLIEPMFTKGLALGLTHGAHKYFVNSWKQVPEVEYCGALGRHLNAHFSGEYIDQDTGLLHLDHAACDLMFIHWFTLQVPRIRKAYSENIINLTYLPKEAK